MVEERRSRAELERMAEEARIEGRDDEALSIFEELVAADLQGRQIAKAVSVYQKIVLWKPDRRDLHQRLAQRIGEARDSGPDIPKSVLFEGIPREQFPEILQSMRPRKFSAGAEIVREGDPGDSLFLITEGSASVNTQDQDGRALVLATLGIGDFFGEVSLLTSRPRTATVRAETTVETLELTRGGLAALKSRFPEIDRALSEFHELRAQKTIEAIIAKRRKRP
jgi:CRP-like cAMP-binding protein